MLIRVISFYCFKKGEEKQCISFLGRIELIEYIYIYIYMELVRMSSILANVRCGPAIQQ
jgi:hypothetical protein